MFNNAHFEIYIPRYRDRRTWRWFPHFSVITESTERFYKIRWMYLRGYIAFYRVSKAS